LYGAHGMRLQANVICGPRQWHVLMHSEVEYGIDEVGTCGPVGRGEDGAVRYEYFRCKDVEGARELIEGMAQLQQICFKDETSRKAADAGGAGGRAPSEMKTQQTNGGPK
jgi:hypothetical protein